MFEKIAEILGKLSGTVLMAAALGIVAVVFVVGLVFSFGGELGKFKKVAKKAIANPTMANFNATAKQLPTRVRKQYKTVKQTGAKPDDIITVDACVYSPYKESTAAHLPGAVMAAGILSILFAFFAVNYVKADGLVGESEELFGITFHYVVPLIVTIGVMVLRLVAGLVSGMIAKSGVKVYEKYVDALGKCLQGGGAQSEPAAQSAPAYAQTVDNVASQPSYDPMFGEERISVELAEEEPAQPVYEQPAFEPVVEAPTESEQEIRAKARAEAMAAARAEQAQRAAAQQAQAEPVIQAEPVQEQAAMSSADEVIARIEQINREGAPLATMKEVALQLQKERAKPENKTPDRQRKLNEALASLLKAMSSANKK